MFITIDSIEHCYNKLRVLNNVNLSIKKNENVAIIGPSGCGKSTLLHIIAGLIKPSKGSVIINEQIVTKPSAKYNVMFQQPSLYPWMSVRENVGLGPKFSGTLDQSQDHIDQAIALTELTERAEQNVQLLSGGQQQRVALARSLATEPEVLLLDEPFSALDVFTRERLQNQVQASVKKLNINMILVTHDIDEAILMGDRIIILDKGKILGDIKGNTSIKKESKQFMTLKQKLLDLFHQTSNLEGLAHVEK